MTGVSGVAEPDVDLAVAAAGCVGYRFDGGGDLGGMSLATPTVPISAETRCRNRIDIGDPGALGGESAGDCRADAATGAGDDDDLVAQLTLAPGAVFDRLDADVPADGLCAQCPTVACSRGRAWNGSYWKCRMALRW